MSTENQTLHGVSCPGCPHRAAYVACKETLGRGRGRVICGNAGCANVGPMHPAATACPGGEEALLDRYKVAVPMGGTSEEPACEAVIHFIPDVDLAAENAAEMLHALPAEGHVTVLAVLASSAEFLTVDALEALAARALELGCDDAAIVDPFDSQKSSDVLHGALARPGVHAVVFASPVPSCSAASSRPSPSRSISTHARAAIAVSKSPAAPPLHSRRRSSASTAMPAPDATCASNTAAPTSSTPRAAA